jgi:hypothetical protein
LAPSEATKGKKMKNYKIGMVAIMATFVVIQIARADTLAKWTFETSKPYGFMMPGSWYTNVAAEIGSGTGSAWHSDFEIYASYPGNGSSAAFGMTNSWNVGDFYQFAASTVGYQNITISFDQTGNYVGPGIFYLAYSTDGNNFTRFGSDYSVKLGAWNYSTVNTNNSYSFNLGAVTAMNNQSLVYFRIIDDSTQSIGGGTAVPGGDNRIDNFLISAQVVPEPTTIQLGLLSGVLGIFRLFRKRQEPAPKAK